MPENARSLDRLKRHLRITQARVSGDINMSNPLGLRPVSTARVSCKICDGPTDLYGVVDLNRPCEIAGIVAPPLAGIPVYYRRCAVCGFLFTDAFDDWSVDQFKEHIYNDSYHLVDPDYKTQRPTGTANSVIELWAGHKASLRVLDYGGGNDVFCAALRANGFKEAVTYDPMVPEYARRPEGKFDLVTCFETLEHVPDPLASIAQIVECVADPGAVYYSTLTQPADFDSRGMSWWYIAPRNGHISIFTKQALAMAFSRHGFKTASFGDGMHMSFRTLPDSWGLGAL